MSDAIVLDNGEARAEIAPLGAELRAWSVAGRPLIWSPDAAIWPDTAPVLFPVVGWTRGGRVLVAGKSYPLSLHGFARTSIFAITDQGGDHVCLERRASAFSRTLYPFDFALSVTYRLVGPALRIELAVENRGQVPMPYACGLHPGFRWPFADGDLSDYTIAFAEAERPFVPIISPQGLFTRECRPVPLQGRHLPLSAELFAHEALCFLDARSQMVRFAHVKGAAIAVALENFPHIALWSRPEGRFLSIEAWTGRGDDVDSDGDLMTKPSMIHLVPGSTGRHVATFSYEA